MQTSTPNPRSVAAFLLPEQEITVNGESASLELRSISANALSVTFGILEAEEQQSIELRILGSPDGESWEPNPLLEFPQKFYRSTSEMLLDLKAHPELSHIKASWTVNRWGRGSLEPRFRAYVFVQPG